MTPESLIIQIRDELRRTREELAARIDEMDSRIDRMNALLDWSERRQTESEAGFAGQLANLVSALNQLKDLIVPDRDLRR